MGYKVKSGDTLTKIAKEHNLPLDALLAMNNMTREQANKIQVGQTLTVNTEPIPKNATWDVPTSFGDKSPFNKPQLRSKNIPSPYKTDYSEQDYLRDNAKSIQQQLIAEKYNVGQRGADGKWGRNSQAALDQALADGYKLENGKLIKSALPKKDETGGVDGNNNLTIPEDINNPEYLKANAKSIQEQLLLEKYDLGPYGADGKWGNTSQKALDKALADGYIFSNGYLLAPKPVSSRNQSSSEIRRTLTPRRYTAAQNTISDAIKAPIKRGIAQVVGDKMANIIMPTSEYNENHISPELYAWLQEAADKKWDPAERKAYFEKYPDKEVTKGWTGRLKGKKAKESDYKKYYDQNYTGPMEKGFKETMFGQGINQAQGTLGSFNITYTKDGIRIEDDWDFGNGNKYDTSTLMGAIRQWEESKGSQENDNLTPIRKLNAFINYR